MALILDGLTKTFSSFPAVNNLSYTMDTGVYGLLGVNGAGKTTLMRMLCTLLTPTSGTITWDGQDIFSLGSAYRNLLGYLPQDFGYSPDFSVQDYLLYIASIKGLRPATARQRMQNLLEQVGLTQVRRQKMKKLSGGMVQRVGIAQALLNDPKILILDEPTAGLDPKERGRFRNILSGLSRDRIVILSTHIVSDVENVANQLILLKDRQVYREDTPKNLCRSMEGRVFETTVPEEEVEAFGTSHLILSQRQEGERVSPPVPSQLSPPWRMRSLPSIGDGYAAIENGTPADGRRPDILGIGGPEPCSERHPCRHGQAGAAHLPGIEQSLRSHYGAKPF